MATSTPVELTYVRHAVRLNFSFRTKAGNNPDAIRDGSGKIIGSVTRTGGVYTITFKSGFKIPRQRTSCNVTLSGSATPTKMAFGADVAGSYDPVARTMQVVVMAEAAGSFAVGEPDDGTWVNVQVCGPGIDAFKDAI